jgi:chromosome segregation ATPase
MEEIEQEKNAYVAQCDIARQSAEENQRVVEELRQRLRDAEARAELSASEVITLRDTVESNTAAQDAERRASEAVGIIARTEEELRDVKTSSDALARELREKVSTLEAALHAARSAPPPALPSQSSALVEEANNLRQQLVLAQKQIEQLQGLLSDARVNKASTGSFTNKKNEDFAETDIEGAVLTGGSYSFVPLQGQLKAATNVPALQHPIALEVASNFDRASVYLQRRPLHRLALAVYILILHLLLVL